MSDRPEFLSAELPSASTADQRRSFWRYLLITTALLTSLFAGLSIHHFSHTHFITETDNVWFGADVARHVHWAYDTHYTTRASLHPISFLVFKSYGLVLRGLHLLPPASTLYVFALPVILISSLCLALSAHYFAFYSPLRRGIYFLTLATALIIGPWLFFAIVPESHLLGGMFLLLEGVLLLSSIRVEQQGGEEKTLRNLRRGALICGLLAAGFTLSNLAPAAILWAIQIRNTRWRAALVVFMVFVPTLLLQLTLLDNTSSKEAEKVQSPLMRRIAIDKEWTVHPDLKTIAISIHRLTLNQFGMSAVGLQPEPLAVYPLPQVSPLQVGALLLWAAGSFLALMRRGEKQSIEGRFVFYCLAAWLSVTLFHASYDPQEAFIFCAHAWPFVLLPGLIALERAIRDRNRVAIGCLAAAITFSLVQLIWNYTTLIPMFKLL
jgi:hypothetical protein